MFSHLFVFRFLPITTVFVFFTLSSSYIDESCCYLGLLTYSPLFSYASHNDRNSLYYHTSFSLITDLYLILLIDVGQACLSRHLFSLSHFDSMFHIKIINFLFFESTAIFFSITVSFVQLTLPKSFSKFINTTHTSYLFLSSFWHSQIARLVPYLFLELNCSSFRSPSTLKYKL